MKFLKIYYIIITLGFVFYGCATIQEKAVIKSNIAGFYHRVEPGQTLWRISKIYNVDLEELIQINNISNVTQIEKGKFIFIPRPKDKINNNQPGTLNQDFIWPLKGLIVSSFGEQRKNIINKGLDIKPKNIYEVMVSRNGKVIFCDENLTGYGKTVIVDHKDGFLTIYTSYGSEILVKLAQEVAQNAPIIKLNKVDNESILHFEIRKRAKPQNPFYYLS